MARTRVDGVRTALDARSQDVLALVLRQGLLLPGLGIGIGLFGAIALTRGISGNAVWRSTSRSDDLRLSGRAVCGSHRDRILSARPSGDEDRSNDGTSVRVSRPARWLTGSWEDIGRSLQGFLSGFGLRHFCSDSHGQIQSRSRRSPGSPRWASLLCRC